MRRYFSTIAAFVAHGVTLAAAPVSVDGTLEAGEWAGSERFELQSGASVQLKHVDGDFYLGLDGFPTEGFGFACVFLSLGDVVLVLHASAQLGTAHYRLRGDGYDPESETYDWKPADQLWREDGWRSHPSSADGRQEFQIAKRLLQSDRGDAAIAVGYVHYPGGEQSPTLGWPEGLSDGSVDAQVVSGWNPAQVKFDIERWHRLR